MSYLLFPGRHLLNTRFQADYLARHVRPGEHVVFAISSCNQSHSRYNPIPFHVRAIGVDRFAREVLAPLAVRYSIYGIPHHGPTPRYVELLLKELREQTLGDPDLRPDTTRVLCSTPSLIRCYEACGFEVLPAEARRSATGDWELAEATPIDLVRRLGDGVDPEEPWLRERLHPASNSVLHDFPEVLRTLRSLYGDPLLDDQGSLSESRDYDTYVRAMGSSVEFKYADIREFLLPGRIIDEGCADGALLARVAEDHPDSDLIGIDLCAEMLARAAERQRAGDFSGCFVFFRQCNLMNPLPLRSPVDTVICNSTLHEIWSYGDGAESVRHYLRLKHDQLRTGGRLVIRDVVGPSGRQGQVLLWCNADDGQAIGEGGEEDLEAYLNSLSTRARFHRFARDFLPQHRGAAFPCEEASLPDGRPAFSLSLQHAMEFTAKMTYTDNWLPEMREEFCFWEFAEWTAALREAGFRIHPGSRAYVNEWRVRNDFADRVALFAPDGTPLPFAETNMVLVGDKE